MEKFLQKVADILEMDGNLTPDTKYSQLENWDSLAVVSTLAMINIEYGKKMRAVDFQGAETLGELYDIIQKH